MPKELTVSLARPGSECSAGYVPVGRSGWFREAFMPVAFFVDSYRSPVAG